MADFLIRFCIGSICLIVHLVVTIWFCSVEKSHILEICYRNRTPNINSQSTNKMIFILRSLTLVDLYKQAKRNREIAQKYFLCNAGLLISIVIALVLWLIMIVIGASIREIVLWQLGFMLVVVIIWASVHFALDALHSPSERKRRNID